MDKLLRELCGDNEEAYKFCFTWLTICHNIDDIVDGDIDKAEVVSNFAAYTGLLSSNFYKQHSVELFSALINSVIDYAISVEWEKLPTEEATAIKRKIADHIRSNGNHVLVTVAVLLGGYHHGIKISKKLYEYSYNEQRNNPQIELNFK